MTYGIGKIGVNETEPFVMDMLQVLYDVCGQWTSNISCFLMSIPF